MAEKAPPLPTKPTKPAKDAPAPVVPGRKPGEPELMKPGDGGKGFKAKYLQKKHSLLVKIGAMEETVDPEFEDVRSQLFAYEKKMNQLVVDIRAYLTAIRTLSTSARKLTDSLIDTVEPDTRMRLTVLKCNSGQDSMDRQVAETIDPAIMQSLDGFSLFIQKFSDYNKRIKDRTAKLADYDRHQKNVSNLKAKPPQDPTKIPAAKEKLEKAKEAYENTNDELISDMKSFLDTKYEDLNPHLRDLVFAHTEFFTAYASELSEAYRYCPEPEDL